MVRARSNWGRALREPLILVVFASFLGQLVIVVLDFQAYYPYVFPLLIYPALGFGAVTAFAARRLPQPRVRRGAALLVVAAATALTAVSSTWLTNSAKNDHALPSERARLLRGRRGGGAGNPPVRDR